ncbi:uncharacterized protein Triagg1_6141 [Trichoderma aggressivum f. europaeum]|uniref:Histidine kinase group protein n=1 Tax=Trichoderma aggressivum f. europaeum TaxID=173218 RepID=A0AAE1LYX5_9HYPO|nr:hypothetical protein Triagg1_6141 [Trichoderma aggressivum f. europaeum]
MNGNNEGAGPSNDPQANEQSFHQLLEDIRRRAAEEDDASKNDPLTQNVRDYMLEDMGVDVTGMEELFNLYSNGIEGMDLGGDHIELLRGINRVTIEEIEVGGINKKKFKFDDLDVEDYFGNVDPYERPKKAKSSIAYAGRDLISEICQHVELAVELGKHLNGKELLNLCLANRRFYEAVNGYLLSSIRAWIEYKAPEAGRIFHYQLYAKHLVDDPQKRTWMALKQGMTTSPKKDGKVRKVPGLKYLQLVLGRDKYCREILAIMARCGHRMPKTMHHSLLRLWLLMDVATTQQRQAMLQMAHIFKDTDLYNMQMFFIKLGMLFNDPVYGPCTFDLVQLMMGQKGLFKLWQLLTRKKFNKLADILDLKLRYDFNFVNEGTYWVEHGLSQIQGIPLHEVGQQHKEGWGAGRMHLLRPDEAVPVEAVRRGLQLDDHLSHMVIWGYFDWKTGENIVPSLEEMYIEDENEVLANVDTLEHWKPRHVLKKRWDKLTPQQQDEILFDEEDERLRAQAWGSTLDENDDAGSPDDDSDTDSDESLDLDEEINRGYIVPPQPKDHESTVPRAHDAQGWVNFVNQSLLGGMVPDLGEDERLKAEAWISHPEPEPEPEIDSEQLLDAFLAELGNRHRQQQWAATSVPQEADGDDGAGEEEEAGQDAEMADEGDVEDDDDNGNNLESIDQGTQFQFQPPSDTQFSYYYPFDDAQMDLDLQSFMPTSAASNPMDPAGLYDGEDELMQDEEEGQDYGDVL